MYICFNLYLTVKDKTIACNYIGTKVNICLTAVFISKIFYERSDCDRL